MTITEQYGFTFKRVSGDEPVVRAFVRAHLEANGFPSDLQPAATSWIAVIRGDGIYCVFGWCPCPGVPNTIIITDLYAYPTRWGTLASYAALERMKQDCDRAGLSAVTVTPHKNDRMIKAYKRILGLTEPSHDVYTYTPPAAEQKGAA